MTGRAEREEQIKQRIESKIEGREGYLDGFCKWMSMKKSATTQECYISYIINFTDYCAQRMDVPELKEDMLGDITSSLISDYIRECSIKWKDGYPVGKNDNSILLTKMCAISTFFHYLMIEGIVDENPCEKVERPKLQEKDNIVVLTQDEIREVLGNIDSGIGSQKAKVTQEKWKVRDKVMFMLPLLIGIRIAALHDLNVSDIDTKNKIVRAIEKENKYREFPVPDDVVALLKEWIEERAGIMGSYASDTEALFIGYYNGHFQRLSIKAMRNVIKKYSSTIPKKVTPHKLRDTFATTVYNETGDIYLVSRMLGHASPETTRKYVEVSKAKRESAVSIMSDFIKK